MGVFFGVMVVGVFAAMVGAAIIRRVQDRANGSAAEALQDLPVTDGPGRKRVVEIAVSMAVELCRHDGSILDTEIVAIEDYLTDYIVDMERDVAEAMVRRALRATIDQNRHAHALTELVAIADAPHRAFVVELLVAVARADGELNAAERAFVAPVASRLGISMKA